MIFNRHKTALVDLQNTINQQAGLLEAINRSMAVIEFDVDRWSAIEPGSGRLIEVMRPKEVSCGAS